MKDFDPNENAYSFLISKESVLPVVEAKAVSSTTAVEIEQPRSIPGTAVIRFVDYNTMQENSYFLNFDHHSISDEFNKNSLGSQWNWYRENSDNHSLSSGSGLLTITTEKGDISEKSNNARNLLLQSANNDWTIETKLFGSRALTT